MNDPSMLVLIGVFLAAALFIVVLNDRHKAYLVRRAEQKEREPNEAWRHHQTSWKMVAWLFLGGPLLVLTIWRWGPMVLWLVLGVCVAGSIFVFGKALWWRWRNRSLIAAFKVAQSGDVDGAVLTMRREIDSRGASAARYDFLGLALLVGNRWEEALGAFAEAERLGEHSGRLANNKAMALCKLGRGEEALPLLEEACRRDPKKVQWLCNYSHVLADLGRREEALAQLRRAERLHQSFLLIPGSVRSQHQRLLQDCKQKVDALQK
jgi:tetratricopeptide (TPR) repeat protein